MEKTIRYLFNLLLVSLFMLTIAVNRNGKIFGTAISDFGQSDNRKIELVNTPNDSAGYSMVSSSNIAKDISGYAGPVPLNMYLFEGKISRIELLPNAETPEFQREVVRTGLLNKWDGLKLSEIAKTKVDAVSGATMTSSAIIATVQRLAAVSEDQIVKKQAIPDISLKLVLAVLVILLGVISPFIHSKSKLLRMTLLILNVVVLGFWCGSFLSLSLLIGWFANGVNLSISLIPFLLLLSAVILPLLGKKNNYCTYHCPMGALQELAYKCPAKKWKIPVRIEKYLSCLRELILYTILLLTWIGVGFEIIDYEIFPAFLFSTASYYLLTAGCVFFVLSLFINRPYCRYICPTGTLIRFSQQNNK